ncbi:MAG: bifunctional diaminohydroxyphosphoribosylaminopyrimidine deaminase/5-amino-6-(5-phosphoribosylamino)uracil reductase RibD [Gammaproteobacteria bacterium]|nr:bifunctional diaminohydroxyphosphoribosylaminopyrimidine deaminase/5-amino-6-(5-phosphoribosylamino)uracil reductase RibD [Gammaproteobacteria bacterium]MCW9004063.1 bifunctional diaminohydroxyphosphoribosylaminopyrimidine deaminase/5-amino-6-(5-phosphoribosylamino)uracil reductase RibD [Gammaproteobacteria bacterium]
MARAIQLAKKGLYTTEPNPRVGCVIVKDNKIVGEGWHEKAGEGHAEINALQQAGKNAQDATVYVTLEPCSHHGKTPPCADALIAAGVKRVIAAMQDPNPLVAGKGLTKLAQAGIEVESDLMEAQAKELNPGFIKRMSQGLPWVRVKLAMSLDGRTAMDSGESKWITGSTAREDVQKLRARSSAILTGIGTVLADNPWMNVRLDEKQLAISSEVRQPLRVVIDSQLKCPQDADMLDLPGRTVIMTTEHAQGDMQHDNVEVVRLPSANNHVDLQAALSWLAEHDINEVHVEAGSVLSGAFLEADLVDEIIVYMAPHIMGNNAKGLFHLPEMDKMHQRIGLEIKDIRPVGIDWRITAKPKKRIVEEL